MATGTPIKNPENTSHIYLMSLREGRRLLRILESVSTATNDSYESIPSKKALGGRNDAENWEMAVTTASWRLADMSGRAR